MNVQRIKEAFEDAGFEPRSYSGRSMYGEECLAVLGDSAIGILLSTIRDFAGSGAFDTSEIVELIDQLTDYRTDQLGMREIIYWPQLKWDGVSS